MLKWMRKGDVVCFAILLGLLSTTSAARGELAPKVDNFIFLVDQSGSMYMHDRSGNLKMLLVKKILAQTAELIPELGYNASLCLFAPFEVTQPPVTYQQSTFVEAIGRIKNDQAVFGRQTPMEQGIRSLGSVLADLSGPTAVILISDGGANQGAYPVPEALNLRTDFPLAVIHAISFAEEDSSRTMLRLVSRAGKGRMVEAAELLHDELALEMFIQEALLDVTPEEPRGYQAHGLKSIYFKAGSSKVDVRTATELNEVVAALGVELEGPILVEGHSDGAGSEEQNQILSERRAEAVVAYLAEKGIAQERIRSVAYGELRPVATNETAEGRSRNRRVEVKVLKQ